MPKKAKQSQPEYVLHYWPSKGRAELIRLTLVVCGLEWKEAYVTDEGEVETKKKSGTAESPFGQWPLLVEDGEVLCQTLAIVKHLGRQHGLYGASAKNRMEDYVCDAFLAGVDALRSKYTDMKYVHGNTPEAKEKFEKGHLNPESKTTMCGGAHLSYLEGFLERSKSDWIAGGKDMSVADIALYDLFGELQAVFGDKLAETYPKCAALHKKIAELPAIAAYLQSDKRHKD